MCLIKDKDLRKIYYIAVLLLMLPNHLVNGQISFDWKLDIPFYDQQGEIPMALAGGLNSVNFNMMDFTNDGKEDYVLFDRTSNEIKTFEFTSQGPVFRPDMVSQFPEIDNWLLLRDFNNDGKKDIFTSHPLGIKIFVNISSGNTLRWRPYNNGKVLLTEGLNSPVNIPVEINDLPAIDDIDGDGDLDILNFGFRLSTLDYNQNISETPDTLIFKKITNRWGEFEECNCGLYAFGEDDCNIYNEGRVEHSRNRTLFTLDYDGDGDKDLMLGEANCLAMILIQNIGDADNALLQNPSSSYPISFPAGIYIYPSVFSEDVDQDGKKDFIVSSNMPDDGNYIMDFKNTVHYYRNIGNNNLPEFNFQQRNFIQDKMLDLGKNSAPEFMDLDYDGDLDMLVSYRGTLSTYGPLAKIYHYDNVGNNKEPEFQLVNEDFLGLSNLGLWNIKIYFADINGDQNKDLVISANSGSYSSSIFFVLNNSFFTLNTVNQYLFNFDFQFNSNNNLGFYDYDNDGDEDILVGSNDGVYLFNNKVNEGNYELEYITNEFYGFTIDPLNTRPSITIGYLDDNLIRDMVVGSQNGTLKVYRDFEEDLENPVEPEELTINLNGIALEGDLPFGTNLKPVITNLFNETLPSIVLGNGQGGLVFLRNTDAEPSDDNLELSIFPNPVLGEEPKYKLFFEANSNVIVEILTINGQKIMGPTKIVNSARLEQSVRSLSQGLYLARIQISPSKFIVRKFVVAY